jgi:hypothetical protein
MMHVHSTVLQVVSMHVLLLTFAVSVDAVLFVAVVIGRIITALSPLK